MNTEEVRSFVWISVSERLPNIAQEVIVHSEFDGVCAGVLDSYGEWFAPCSEYKLIRVTSWIQMPTKIEANSLKLLADLLGNDHDKRIMAERHLLAMLANAPAAPAADAPPESCRQRLAAEGKPYPRSSCAACGQFSTKWRECDAALAAHRANGWCDASLIRRGCYD